VTTADRFRREVETGQPWWLRFIAVCDEAWASGRQKWSADAAIHIVRWTMGVDVDNRFSSHAARAYLAMRPDRPRFFELRASQADARPSPQMELGV
jgi:hypothetical protein